MNGERLDREPLQQKEVIYAFLITLLVLLAAVWANPIWESNDDVAMSMIVHGFGISAERSNSLLFTNSLIGDLIHVVLGSFDLHGYAAFYYLLLGYCVFHLVLIVRPTVRACWHVLWLVLLACLLFKPLVQPQFTITSGLLAFCAILVMQRVESYKHTGYWTSLILLAISVLVREQEAVYVFLLAQPLLLSKWKKRPKLMLSYPIWLVLFVVVFRFMDASSYSGPGWDEYNKLNIARAPYTDFGAWRTVADNEELLKKYDYSENDIQLVRRFFFIDRDVANSRKLSLMLEESGFLSLSGKPIDYVRQFKKVFTSEYLGYLALAVALLLLAANDKRLYGVGFLFLASFFVLCYLGRGQVMRVYYPVLVMLAIQAAIVVIVKARDGRTFVSAALASFAFVALIAHLIVWQDKHTSDLESAIEIRVKTRQLMAKASSDMIVAWGSAYPYTMLFSPFQKYGFEQYDISAIGVSTLAPFSNEVKRIGNSRGILDTLKRGDPIYLFSSNRDMILLNNYCLQRFSDQTKIENLGNLMKNSNLYRVRCVPREEGSTVDA